jgi:uncharacterized hydrophobic protein (TIGR00271 family)
MQKSIHALSPIEKQQIYQTIVEGSEPKLSFYILVVLSTVIAAYGLIANSTAVVIGAMIVAPLMTPIIGIALSLVSSDSHLFRLAIIAEIAGVICSIALGFMAGKFTFGVELSSEILARTQPLPYDILVALAAGFAGAYSLVNPKINAALAGVAIAVSLVPPLASTGICLALERYDLALGAFLLFFANFLAIQLASVFIFISNGFIDYFHYKENEFLIKSPVSKLKLLQVFSKRFLPSIILLLLVTWHLSQTLINLVNNKQFQRQLEAIVKEEVQKRTGARLTEVNYKKDKDGKINAIAVVMTPQEFSPNDIDKIQQHIQRSFDKPIDLIIRSIISKDADVTGTIFLLDEEKLKRQQQSEKSNFLNEMTRLLKKALENIPGAYLDEVRREDDNGTKTVVAIIRTPAAIKPNQVQMMELPLQTLDKNIRLVVRSILTRDADATRYLYESVEGSITDPLSEEELALHKKLELVLKKAIKKIVKGGVLLDFQYTSIGDMIEVLAVIQTPNNFSNRQVKQIQTQLKKEADSRIKLIVRSVVGTDMDENGFVIPEEIPQPEIPTIPPLTTKLKYPQRYILRTVKFSV